MKKKIMAMLAATMCLASSSLCFSSVAIAANPQGDVEIADVNAPSSEAQKSFITVDDILSLSKKGEALTWSDFEKYEHTDVGSGLIVWEFMIKDDSSKLLISGNSSEEKPEYINYVVSNGAVLDVQTEEFTRWFYDDSASASNAFISVNDDPSLYPDDCTNIISVYNTPLRFAFTEYSNIDGVLTGKELLAKYYAVEHKDGSFTFFNEDLKKLKSNSYTEIDGKTVELPFINMPEGAVNAYKNSDFAKKYISPDAEIESVYYLSSESSMMGTAVYYKTSVGDYVYFVHYDIGSALFPITDFCKYQQAINDEISKHQDLDAGDLNIAGIWNLSEYELQAITSGIMGDVNDDDTFEDAECAMTVTVSEINGETLLVKSSDGKGELLTLSTKYLDSSIQPKVGMKLEVVYTGGILQTYPCQFGNVKKVFVVSDNTTLMGDVNADGEFGIADVILLQKWLLAVPDTHLANWKAADYCEDNKLNVFDLCLMKRALIEKMNDEPQNVDISFKFNSVTDIRYNDDNHTKWTGFVARSENDLINILAENEGVSADKASIEGIDSNTFKDKSIVIVYSICTAGNSYSIIDNISVKGTSIDVSTISKKPMVPTPDMLFRRYVYVIDKNAVTNADSFNFTDESSYYQYDEENEAVAWFKEWCQAQ